MTVSRSKSTAVNVLGPSILIDGLGSTITTGIKCDVRMPFTGTILGWYLFADQTGSIQIDLWKDTQANFPPVDADSITAAAPPVISSATNASSTTLTGWVTSFIEGDVIRVNVDSATSITKVTLSLALRRTA